MNNIMGPYLPISFTIEPNGLLNGSQGTNRYDPAKCQINAHNDYEAVMCWLNEYKHKLTTYRCYKKEAERLLLWCIYQAQKPLSSLTSSDFDTYFDFLANPTPKDFWCNPKKPKRTSKQWKPFTGPLNKSAQRTAISIIGSLMAYLVNARYLEFNPLSIMRRFGNLKSNAVEEKLQLQNRILESDEWSKMVEVLQNYPENNAHQKDEKQRLIIIVSLLFLLGLRVGDLVTHTWRAFQKSNGKWWFIAKGKGDKVGMIPVNQQLLLIIKNYRLHLMMAEEPQGEDLPIVMNWHRSSSISARHINRLLKDLAYNTAKCFADQPDKVEKLKRFSAHWLRHLSATIQDKAGIRFEHIKANHRHENENTTRRYIHDIDNARHGDMEKLVLF